MIGATFWIDIFRYASHSLGVIYIPNQCIYYFSIPYGDGKQRASHRCFDGGKIKLKNKQIDKIKKN